jgi:hypothetical protein
MILKSPVVRSPYSIPNVTAAEVIVVIHLDLVEVMKYDAVRMNSHVKITDMPSIDPPKELPLYDAPVRTANADNMIKPIMDSPARIITRAFIHMMTMTSTPNSPRRGFHHCCG